MAQNIQTNTNLNKYQNGSTYINSPLQINGDANIMYASDISWQEYIFDNDLNGTAQSDGNNSYYFENSSALINAIYSVHNLISQLRRDLNSLSDRVEELENPTTITLNPSENQDITEAITINATVNNGNANKVNWTLSNPGTTGNTFQINSSPGSSVTVTPNNTTAPEANTGTTTISAATIAQTTTSGTATFTAGFTVGEIAITSYSTTVTASYTGATSKSITLRYQKSTNPLSEGTYTWEVVSGKSMPVGLTLTSDGKIATITNTGTSNINLPAGTIQVTNSNGTTTTKYNADVSVPGKIVETQYYWYVGTKDPSTMSSVSSVVNDTTSPGWRLIGTTVPTYTMQSPLWDGQVNEIVFNSYRDITAYIALPNANIKVRDGLGNDVTSEMVSKGTQKISGVTYTIYQNSSNVMSYSLDLLVY